MLGLATEVAKLEESERLQIVELATEEVSGKVPLAVTVYGYTVEQQIRFAGLAQSRGTDWLILQPPAGKGTFRSELSRFLWQGDRFRQPACCNSECTGIPGCWTFGEGPHDLARTSSEFHPPQG